MGGEGGAESRVWVSHLSFAVPLALGASYIRLVSQMSRGFIPAGGASKEKVQLKLLMVGQTQITLDAERLASLPAVA